MLPASESYSATTVQGYPREENFEHSVAGGATSARGKGATIGGSVLTHKSVFESSGTRNKRPSFIEGASKPGTAQKHFTKCIWSGRSNLLLDSRQLLLDTAGRSEFHSMISINDRQSSMSAAPAVTHLPIAVPNVKRPKFSADDWKRKHAMKALGSQVKRLMIWSQGKQSIALDFGLSKKALEHSWGQKFANLTSIQVDQM